MKKWKRSDFWSWLAFGLAGVMLLVMLMPGSFCQPMGHGRNCVYTAYFGQDEGGIFGYLCFALGFLMTLFMLNWALSDRKGIVPALVFGLPMLFFVFLFFDVSAEHWLPVVPPLLAITSMAAAFAAWIKSKKE